MTSTGSETIFQTLGSLLMEQQIRFSVNRYNSRMNHQEWYMSKKPKALYNRILVSLSVARYSRCGPCWMMVPMIEVRASPMSRKIVSFKEQKKSHSLCATPRLFVVKAVSRKMICNRTDQARHYRQNGNKRKIKVSNRTPGRKKG